jgi:Tetracyclin repressor-like, C-terminal domain
MALAHTDDLVTDLRAHLRDLSAALKRSTWAALLPTVIDTSARDAGFAALARAFSASRRAPLRLRLDAALASGQLPGDIDTDVLAAQLTGPLFYRRFVSHQPISAAVVDQIVRLTVAPLVRA